MLFRSPIFKQMQIIHQHPEAQHFVLPELTDIGTFGLDPKPPTAALPKPKHPYIRQFREDEMLCFRALTDYLHLLEDWKVRYAPKTPDDALDDRFVEACQMLDYIEYLADILTVGDLEERVAVVEELMKEGKIAFLRDYVARKRKEWLSHGEER